MAKFLQKLSTFVTAVTLLYFSGQIQRAFADSADILTNGFPGQPYAVKFAQYAGYVRLPGTQKYFYYTFIEAEATPELQPLVLWLNGGPGCSSIGGGLLAENGPWRLKNSKGRSLKHNPFSWNKAANMLFVESPVGVGFSYSNNSQDYITNDNVTSVDNYLFLYGWFQKFPLYQNRTIYLSGESYAGHYVPQLAKQILDRNQYPAKYTFTMPMKLNGVVIGNPYMNDYYDALGSNFAIASFFQTDSYYSPFDPYNAFAQICSVSGISMKRGESKFLHYEKFYDKLRKKMTGAKTTDQSRNTDEKKGTKATLAFPTPFSVDNPECYDIWIHKYLNNLSVRKAINAYVNPKASSWTVCASYSVISYYMDVYSTVYLLKDLIKAKLRVWLYAGDMDTVVPFYGTRKNIESLNLGMNPSSYQPWYYYDQPSGWVGSYMGLTALTVKGAGHFVPYDQPEIALYMFKQFLANRNLSTSSFS